MNSSIVTPNQTKQLSNQELKWVRHMCSDMQRYYDGEPSKTFIRHYCSIVLHGRTKSSREKGGNRKKQLGKTVQYTNSSRRNRRIQETTKILHGS